MTARNHLKALCLATSALTLATAGSAFAATTATPIQHVIVVVGENHTFDNLFGTYMPTHRQSIDNLVSKGIVNWNGTPGPNFDRARQRIGKDDSGVYSVLTPNAGFYWPLPQPYTTYAIGQPGGVIDTRFPTNLWGGPFQISKYAPYNNYSGDPVHRFFQMWQDWNGGKLDKFVWVEQTIGTGSNGAPVPAGGFNPKEGAISMGFFNMNSYTDAAGKAHSGDAPIFKSLADTYAISDNYHQSVMGGTGANFQALITGHAAFYTDPAKLDGKPATPPVNQIENPNPLPGTNNYYTQDGYGGGSYVNCADARQPGVMAVRSVIRQFGVNDARCEYGHYYLVNNYNLYWNQTPDKPRALGPDKFVMPPQTAPTIADVMTKNGVSWKYYSGDRGDDVTNFATNVDGVPLLFHAYCGICDPLTGYAQIMSQPTEYAKLQNYGAFLADVKGGSLPAVSFVRPFEPLAGHPADSNADLYEKFLADMIAKVQANPDLWQSTAIFITTDEGGGYYDSGYIQPVDFFGDGTRIPLIAVSPYAKKGYIDHTYYDHASILKFIERNWKLPTISPISRDHLPNPIHDNDAYAYRPLNVPAVGDMMNLFTFSGP